MNEVEGSTPSDCKCLNEFSDPVNQNNSTHCARAGKSGITTHRGNDVHDIVSYPGMMAS